MSDTINIHAVKHNMNRIEALDHLKLVLADRGEDYGTPRGNHQIVADLLNTLQRHHKNSEQWTPQDTMLMMILVKVARLCNSPNHIDSWLDIAGYAVCGIDSINEEF